MSPSLPSTRLTVLTLLSATATIYFLYKSRHRHRHLLTRLRQALTKPDYRSLNPASKRGKLFFLSHTNTSKTLAQRLHTLLTLNNIPFDLVDPKDYEPEDLCKETLVLIIASTWENGGPPQNGDFLVNWLAESADDFRVGALVLKECKYAVFGVGSMSYGETFNAVARGITAKLRKLGASELVELGEGDVDEGDLDEVFDRWSKKIVGVLNGNLGENEGQFENYVVGSESEGEGEFSEEDDDEVGENGGQSGVVDLEDIAGKGPSRRSTVAAKANGKVNGQVLNGEKEMVTPVIRANLEKQVSSIGVGAMYSLIGCVYW